MNVLTVVETGGETPAWDKTAFFEDDGEIFIPYPATGRSYNEVLLAVSFDGVDIYRDQGHLYVPLSWAKNEFPLENQRYLTIEGKVLEARKQMGLVQSNETSD